MAKGGEGPPLLTAVIEDMTTGWEPFAPPHKTSWNPAGEMLFIDGPIWEKLDGMRWHEGVLARRQAITEITPFFFDDIPWGYSFDAIVEFPWYIFQANISWNFGGKQRAPITIVITNLDIWKHDPVNGWVRLTPVYAEGTVTVGAGSDTVTGVGTQFQNYNISRGMHIVLGSEIHEIDRVNSETSLILTSAHTTGFAGDTNIIRNFNNGESGSARNFYDFNLFARIFNGDLFVGGTTVGGADQPAIIKIPEIFLVDAPLVFTGAAFVDPVFPNYIMANFEVELPMFDLESTIIGDTLQSINGMDLMQDGRVIALTEEGGDRNSRLRYSSPLDQKKWQTSPAGFTDVVAGGNSMMTGLERLGRIFAIHYHDTIVVGQPTGQDDPPLAFDSSRAQIGTAFARTIKTIGGLQYFMAQDGSIYTFDGSSTQLVTNAFRQDFEFFEPYFWPIGAGAWLDDLRREYTVTTGALGGQFTDNHLLVVVNWETGEIRRELYQLELLPQAAGDKFLGFPKDDGDGNPASRAEPTATHPPIRGIPVAESLPVACSGCRSMSRRMSCSAPRSRRASWLGPTRWTSECLGWRRSSSA